ncbi:MAG: PAS domain S-box protein, partial [Spirochaetes bacterium]|nr:PAS domain S-box protein [Spirochaetota bacterium]
MPASRGRALLPCLCVVLCFSLAHPPGASGQQTAPPSPITVVSDDNYPPYILRDPEGELRGILVDQWKLWERKTGIAVTLVAMDWGKALRFMAEGKADVIDTIFFTGERAKLYDFTRPWATIEVPIFFHKNIGGISDARSLRGFTVGVKEGDAAIDFLTQNGNTMLEEFPSYEAIVLAAADQKIRVFCIDAPPGRYFLYRLHLENEFRSTAPLYTGQFHRAVRKGSTALLRTVEEGFAKISASEYAAIERRWMGSPLLRRPEIYRHLLYAGIGITVLALALLLWIRTLRREVAARTAQLRETLEARRKSEVKYRELVENANSIILRMDRSGTVSFLNEYGQRFFGYAEQEIVGRSVRETIMPEVEGTGRSLARLIEELASSPETHQSNVQENMRSNGERVWIHWTNRAVRDKAGEVQQIFCVGADVTELHHAEDALRESEARFRLLAENANDVIWTMDQAGRFTYVSPSVKKLRGYEPSEVLAQSMEDAVTPHSLAVVREALKDFDSLLAAGVRSFDVAPIEVEQTRRDGSTVWTEVSVTPLLDEAGRLRSLLGVSRDISERKQREEESRALEAQMLQAQKLESLGVLAGGIAHDFN